MSGPSEEEGNVLANPIRTKPSIGAEIIEFGTRHVIQALATTCDPQELAAQGEVPCPATLPPSLVVFRNNCHLKPSQWTPPFNPSSQKFARS